MPVEFFAPLVDRAVVGEPELSRIKNPSSAGHTDDRLAEAERPGGAEEARVAEGEDAAVGGDEPVALRVGGGGHAPDRLAEAERPGGAEEARVAEGEDAAVGGDEPVALRVGGGGHAHDRLAEAERP